MNIQRFIEEYQPCDDGKAWLFAQPDMETAWNTCPNSDWMLWALKEIGYTNQRTLRLLACDFVRRTPLADGRTVWDLLTDERSRTAVEVAERYAVNKATDEELAAAWGTAGVAARAAAWAAVAGAAAARDTAGPAAGAAATGAAAWAAATGAAVPDAGAASAAAEAANAAQSNMIRARIPWEDIAPLLEDAPEEAY